METSERVFVAVARRMLARFSFPPLDEEERPLLVSGSSAAELLFQNLLGKRAVVGLDVSAAGVEAIFDACELDSPTVTTARRLETIFTEGDLLVTCIAGDEGWAFVLNYALDGPWVGAIARAKKMTDIFLMAVRHIGSR